LIYFQIVLPETIEEEVEILTEQVTTTPSIKTATAAATNTPTTVAAWAATNTPLTAATAAATNTPSSASPSARKVSLQKQSNFFPRYWSIFDFFIQNFNQTLSLPSPKSFASKN
jgi:hypothetical protein